MKLVISSSHKNNHQKVLPSLSRFKRRSLAKGVATLTGAVLCSVSTLVQGLGLGEIQSTSFIGQPLRANIDLVSVGREIDVDTILVRQVSAEEAASLGVELVAINKTFDLKIDKSQGIPFIVVESKQPVKEPYLNLLVELRWPNGVVYREYPVLLDPPPKAPIATSRAAKAFEPRGEIIAETPKPRASSETSKTEKTVAGTRRLKLDPLATSSGKYRVQSGDTLSKIAERWREGTDRGIYDTMQWLYENNLHAFTNQNIDLLRAGATLQMPDLSAYAVDNEVPSEQEQARAVQVKEPTEGKVEPKSAEELNQQVKDSVQHVDVAQDDASRGLLTVGNVNQDDTTRELIDMLVRENESLRERMEKIENSEYLETLKQLIILQRQQIAELRDRVGVSDTQNSAEIEALLAKIGVAEEQSKALSDSIEVVVNDEQLALEDQSTTAEVELASENVSAKKVEDESLAPVKVDPVLSAPVMANNEQKSWLFWVILGGGSAIITLFAGLLVYLRRNPKETDAKTAEDYVEEDLFDELEASEHILVEEHFDESIEPSQPLVVAPLTASEILDDDTEIDPSLINYDGKDPEQYLPQNDDESEQWMGESAEVTQDDMLDMDAAMKEVQEAFDDLLLDDSVLEELETDTVLEAMTHEIDTTEIDDEPVIKRSEDELRLSIAEKMAQYNPEEYRKEIENLGLLELDELSEFDEEHDETDTTVYRAMMFCEFKKFTKARELIQSTIDEGNEDTRLVEALEQIDALEASLNDDSQQVG